MTAARPAQPDAEVRGPSRLAVLFGIDPRALAAFRIGLAALILIDLLVMRGPRFAALYTDAGVLPRRLLRGGVEYSLLPFHMWSGGLAWQLALDALLVVCAVALLLGLRTRLASVGCWVLLTSLQVRNPFVLNFGDDLLRQLSFWGMFLPLGCVMSLDARRRPPVDPRTPVLSPATAALLLQVAFVYFFTGLLKSGRDWWPDGIAVWYAINDDYWARPMGVWMRAVPPWILQAASYGTLLLEWFAPWLLFSPIATLWVRGAAVASFALFQLSLAASLVLGLFPAANLLALVPFLPRELWDRVLPARAAARSAPAAPAAPRTPLVVHVAVGVLLAYVLAFNVNGVRPLVRLPEWLTNFGYAIRLNQRWAMYSPNVPPSDGFFVFEARLANGEVVDLSDLGPELRWERPPDLASTHRSFRWARYLYQLTTPETNQVLRRRLAWWLCGDWNARHGPEQQAQSVGVNFIYGKTPHPGGREQTERRRLVEFDCRKHREP